MTPYQKAILTRTDRLSKAFFEQHGRMPTITELGKLYSIEMSTIASKSSRNSKGTGGFAHTKKMNPKALKEWQEKGRKSRWG